MDDPVDKWVLYPLLVITAWGLFLFALWIFWPLAIFVGMGGLLGCSAMRQHFERGSGITPKKDGS